MQQANNTDDSDAGGWSVWLSYAMKIVLFIVVVRFVFGFGGSSGSSGEPNLWLPETAMEATLFLSENSSLSSLRCPSDRSSLPPSFSCLDSPTWRKSSLIYSSTGSLDESLTIPVDEHLLRNGSLHVHFFLTRNGFSSFMRCRRSADCVHVEKNLVVFAPPPKRVADIHLLSSSVSSSAESLSPPSIDSSAQNGVKMISYWTPLIVPQIVEDRTAYPRGGVPPPFADHLRFFELGNGYKPLLFFNTFFVMKDNMMPINSSLSSLPLRIQFGTTSTWKFLMAMQMESQFAVQEGMGLMGDGQVDDMKRMFLETNVYLLAVTGVVSLLHTIFEFLAFKNDIAFWNNNQSMEGLSVRTVVFNAFSQLVIFLYLLDSEASWMIIISGGIGAAIELWKVTKALRVVVDRAAPHWWQTVRFEDRDSYVNRTREFDQQAMRYLSYLFYPLMVGYAAYSLYYETHRGWYSFVLNTLVGFIYAFGFIAMTPQLFINYKLKSVAHMPWKAFMYKALNTFIDDLFSFIIKMPTLHRISCFRDDIVFIIYLYQRWIYPVDPTRVNEYGQKAAEGPANASAPPPQAVSSSSSTADAAAEKKKQ